MIPKKKKNESVREKNWMKSKQINKSSNLSWKRLVNWDIYIKKSWLVSVFKLTELRVHTILVFKVV